MSDSGVQDLDINIAICNKACDCGGCRKLVSFITSRATLELYMIWSLSKQRLSSSMAFQGELSHASRPPYASQDPKKIRQLVEALQKSSSNGRAKNGTGYTCKTSRFEIAQTTGLSMNSWRFLDWDYKRDDLPTYARGLFTYTNSDGSPTIAARGYDKFFNVEEVNDTKWRNVEKNTKGPYELSVKENGCIIFISGLEGDNLLVCSKHSTGARPGTDLSHAVAGERWVDKHLATVGKNRRDLARELRGRNATAVAELCDDKFEEHVLAYDEKSAGLYLHGINLNLPEFATYASPLVHEFADEWGFRKADFLVKDDIQTVKAFLENCAETGSWNGRDTEGFVIRCQKLEEANGPFVDWFFKYKFDEPYLMYRQWREATKAIIAGRAPRFKRHKKITEEYLLYAKRQLARTPGLGKSYNANHGIIHMRDGFLKERGLKGSDIIRQEYGGEGSQAKDIVNNVILVPIASIGCGKTTLAVALRKLFNWGHFQNDNITTQKNRPKIFATQVTNSLAEWPVVIADRNNHQKRERKQLIDDVLRVVPDARFVALHFVHDPKPTMLPAIRRVTQQRVLNRGDNHQTIQAGSKSQGFIIGIMDGFLQRFEPLDRHSDPDDGFDEIIDLDVLEDSRGNLETIVTALRSAYPNLIPRIPSATELDEAITAALDDYRPHIKHELNFQSRNKGNQKKNGERSLAPAKPGNIEFFCLRVPSVQILSALESIFTSMDPAVAGFYRQLQYTGRIQQVFHVTLIHRASAPQRPEVWEKYSALQTSTCATQPGLPNPVLGQCRIRLDRVIWDQRLMCVIVSLQDENWICANVRPHITVGTADSSIKPKESNDLLERWIKNESGDVDAIQVVDFRGVVEIDGEAKAVLPGTR